MLYRDWIFARKDSIKFYQTLHSYGQVGPLYTQLLVHCHVSNVNCKLRNVNCAVFTLSTILSRFSVKLVLWTALPTVPYYIQCDLYTMYMYTAPPAGIDAVGLQRHPVPRLRPHVRARRQGERGAV